MHYHLRLENIVLEANPEKKISDFKAFYNDYLNKKSQFDYNYTPYELKNPSYNDFLKIVLPKHVKTPKHFKTNEGKIILLHTIAHIEYSAIDLALDAALRFKDLPDEYYDDWLEVANDEVRHFEMLEGLLKELGSYYGELEVHTNLFEAMKSTPDLLSRMAVVPRFLEANGLEQNPKIMEKLNSNIDDFNQKILDALEIILEEEVDHVTKGDRWFKFECERQGLDPEKTYIEILERVFPGSTTKKYQLNIEARKKAGFSCDELKFLAKKDDCS